MNKFARLVIPTAAALSAMAARADTAPDVSSLTTVATNVGIVGSAVFALIVAIKGVHWIRRAL
jgi:hypothetical protein